jgi:ferritin-like metal-binding protein YciE
MEPKQKLIQYLNEAHASEIGLVRVLQSQVAMTPRGTYRTAVERHLRETRGHAERLEARLGQLGEGGNPLQAGLGMAETVVAQALALSKTPIDMLRGGTSGAEKVLKNAKDAAATEALEIATYTSIEHLARAIGDDETARLAVAIRRDEERMLDRILTEIPKLTDAVLADKFDLTKIGAADAGRAAVRRTARTASRAGSRTRRTTRQARRVPGVARTEGAAKGAVAGAADLPIAGYESLNADEITGRLSELSQIDLAKVETYERRNDNRATVIERIQSLRGNEPWPGYDEQNVDEIRSALGQADADRAKAVRDYERAHKGRAGVLEVADREMANA